MRNRLRSLVDQVVAVVRDYALKFGVVGLIGYGIDVGIFNLLRLGVIGEGTGIHTPIGAKIVSVSVAIVFNWLGNRYWTFRAHRRTNRVAEFVEYVLVSLGGMVIGLACLWISHYVLGFTSLLADNISGNVIGLGLGSLFRFVLYRYWVWGNHRTGARAADEEAAVEEAAVAAVAGAPLADVIDAAEQAEEEKA